MKKLFILFTVIFLFAGCNNLKTQEGKKEVDNRAIEIEKLKQALLDNGYIFDDGMEKYKFVSIETQYESDGTIRNSDISYFDVNNLQATDKIVHMPILRMSTINDYYFMTDIGNGREVYFEEDSNEWENSYSYTYDFNSGISNCEAMVGSCNRQSTLIDLKNRWISFMKNNNIDIEKIK